MERREPTEVLVNETRSTWAQPLPATLRGGDRPWEDVTVPGEEPAFWDEWGTLVIARRAGWR
jgi:hypothetical protein